MIATTPPVTPAVYANAHIGTDFHLYRSAPVVPAGSATIVDFNAITTPAPGYRVAPVYAVLEKPIPINVGPLMVDSTVAVWVYRYNCNQPAVRGDNFIVYNKAYRAISWLKQPTPWRVITPKDHLAEDFARFCSTNPKLGDIGPSLPGTNLREAVSAVRQRLHWRPF